MARDRERAAVERAADRARLLDHRDQAQVPVTPGPPVVAPQRTEDRDAEWFEGAADQVLVGLAADSVEDDAADRQPGVEGGVAVDDGGNGLTHGACVDDEHDRRAQELGDGRGAGRDERGDPGSLPA